MFSPIQVIIVAKNPEIEPQRLWEGAADVAAQSPVTLRALSGFAKAV